MIYAAYVSCAGCQESLGSLGATRRCWKRRDSRAHGGSAQKVGGADHQLVSRGANATVARASAGATWTWTGRSAWMRSDHRCTGRSRQCRSSSFGVRK
jgi:hypothetical protein